MNAQFNLLNASALEVARHYFLDAVKNNFPADIIANLHADMRAEERKAAKRQTKRR